MNLAGRASHRGRNRPVVDAGTKGPKQRRQKTEERQSSQCLRERRLPLAPLTAETSNPTSLMEAREELYFPLRKKLFRHNRGRHSQLN
jgi:hypothetical protein